MERLAFLAIYALGLAYFLLKKRNFDAIGMSFFGSAVYFFPAVLGYAGYTAQGRQYITEIYDETYVLISFVMFCIIAIGVVYDASRLGRRVRELEKIVVRKADLMAIRALAVIALLCLVAVLANVGTAAFTQKKAEFNEDLGRSFVVFRNVVLFGLVASTLLKLTKYKYYFLALLFVELAMGFRSFLFLGVAALLWIGLIGLGRVRLAFAGWKYSLSGLLAIVIFTVLKGYIGGFRMGGMQYARNADYSLEYIASTFSLFEPFVIMNNLNTGLAYTYDQPMFDFVRSIMASAIPFAGYIAPSSVSRNFAEELFSEVGYGLAFSPWLDVYSAGGWILVVLFAAIYAGSMPIISRYAISSKGWVLRAAVIASAISWCTYIHRNTVGYELTAIRRILYVAFIAYLIRLVFRRISRREMD